MPVIISTEGIRVETTTALYAYGQVIPQRKKKAMKFRILSLRSFITALTVLTMLLGTVACGERETPTAEPVASPTEVTPTPTSTTESEKTPNATFEKTDCPFDVPEGTPVECGFVVVPEDHSKQK